MMPSKSFVFRFDDVEVREREFTLIKAGKVLTVEPKAFRALLFLLHNPQRLIPKEELLHTVWGDAAVTDGSLTRCVWLLRSALGDDIRQPRYIKTVATVGYRFVCKVEVSEDIQGGPAPAGLPDGGGGSKPPDLNTQASGGPTWSFRRVGCLSLPSSPCASSPPSGTCAARCPRPASRDISRSPTTAAGSGSPESTQAGYMRTSLR